MAEEIVKRGVLLWDGENKPLSPEIFTVSLTALSYTVTTQGLNTWFDHAQNAIQIHDGEKSFMIPVNRIVGLDAQKLSDHVQLIRKTQSGYQLLMSTNPFEQFVLIDGKDSSWKASVFEYKKSPDSGVWMPPAATDTVLQDHLAYMLIDRALVAIDLDKKSFKELSTIEDNKTQMDTLGLKADEGHTVSLTGMHDGAILLRLQVGEGSEALYVLYIAEKATQLWHLKDEHLTIYDMKGKQLKRIDEPRIVNLYLPRNLNEIYP